jgi:hypothetical protein
MGRQLLYNENLPPVFSYFPPPPLNAAQLFICERETSLGQTIKVVSSEN